jgi:catechol 2,3-dioxygenase-like lactoylglutathione lyase family enzyme
MIDHISIGVRDIAKTRKFYDAALKPLGYTRMSDGETSLGYGKDKIEFWILASAQPVPANPQSGLHICFSAGRRASVDAFYKSALTAGGSGNGEPGLRPDYGDSYYAAFVIDPDGYRIEAYCGNQASSS